MIKPIYKLASLVMLSTSLLFTPILDTSAYASGSSTPAAQEQSQDQAPKAMVQLSGPALTSVGDSFAVTVSLTGATGDATAGKFIFEYDPTQFEYISATSANSAVSIAGVNAESGKVTLVTMDTTGSLTTAGSLLTLTFKANAPTDLSGISGTVELGIDDGKDGSNT